MKRNIILYIVFVLLLSSLQLSAQQAVRHPKIGEKLNDFSFNGIQYYNRENANLSEFQGKWLILQFWGEFCSGSLKSLPMTNELQEKFADNLQVLLIGDVRKRPETIERLYKVYRDKFGLKLPVVFDHGAKEHFDVGGFPFMMIIDPKGNLKAVTNRLNESEIEQFLQGKSPKVSKAYFGSEVRPSQTYNRDLPLLVHDNGGDSRAFLYRSLLSNWNSTMPSFRKFSENGMELLGKNLKTLYKFAYFGTDHRSYRDDGYGEFSNEIIIETADSSDFIYDYDSGKNIFSYSLKFSEDITNPKPIYMPNERSQDILKRDLSNYFSHQVEIETRKMPFYKMVIDKAWIQKLKSKGGEKISEWKYGHRQGIVINNKPIGELIPYILTFVDYPLNTPIIIEGDKNILIDINIESSFFSDMISELKSKGISLELSEKEMKVLVVK